MSRVAALEAKTAPLSVRGDDFFIIGTNVFIQDGGGNTGGASGTGDLTIGYNRLRTEDGEVNERGGSHNLILGDSNNYASVSGGFRNTASGGASCVSGGVGNTAANT